MTNSNYYEFPKINFEREILSLNTTISPKDGMFQGNLDHYFGCGISALNCIRNVLFIAKKTEVNTILDFPCGYGRVMRSLRAAFPKSQITACDLEKEGVDFCNNIFNAIPVYSNKEPENIYLEHSYDLIWCGSLFTHFNQIEWEKFLNFFIKNLNSNGILIFTSHGRKTAERIKAGTSYGLSDIDHERLLNDFLEIGFGYYDYPNMNNYGISLSSPSWVLQKLEKFSDIRILSYYEYGWDNHHDVVACQKLV
jgi:SAM-dependent methyltransferase